MANIEKLRNRLNKLVDDALANTDIDVVVQERFLKEILTHARLERRRYMWKDAYESDDIDLHFLRCMMWALYDGVPSDRGVMLGTIGAFTKKFYKAKFGAPKLVKHLEYAKDKGLISLKIIDFVGYQEKHYDAHYPKITDEGYEYIDRIKYLFWD